MITRSLRPVLETYDLHGRQYRHPRAYRRRWSSYYGAKGGGFGSMSWKEDRDLGVDYPDIGYWFPVKLRKGLDLILFDGFIVAIEESQGDRQSITITAVGWGSVFSDDRFNWVFVDGRHNKWTGSNTESGSFQPEQFSTRTGDQLYFEPRRSVDFIADDYTYLRYTLDFGESPARVAFDFDLALPGSWPGKLEIRDDNGVLWSKTATETGSGASVLVSSTATFIEIRLYVTSSGENTAIEGTVYGKLTNVQVYTAIGSRVTTTEVLKKLVAFLEGRGLSDSDRQIVQVSRSLPNTVVFDTDQTPQKIMEWCTQFGDTGDRLVAWGTRLDAGRTVYLEEQDLTTIKYIVKRSSGLNAQVSGDVKKSHQKAYAVYTDQENQVVRTDDAEDLDLIEDSFGGHYRREGISLRGSLSSDSVEALLDLRLAENKHPKVASSFTVHDHVFSPGGRRIPVDELQAGGIVRVDDFRAREASMDRIDARTQWSAFQLIGVEINEDQHSARLIPASDRRSFDLLVARMRHYQQE